MPKLKTNQSSKKTTAKKSAGKDNFTKACEYLKEKPVLPDVSMLKEKDRLPFLSLFKITKIIEAQKKKDKYFVNYHTTNYKYFPWPKVAADEKRPGGFGFSDSFYDCSGARADVGARLYTKDSATALKIFKENEELYKNWLLILPEK